MIEKCNACGSENLAESRRKARFKGMLNGRFVDFIDDVISIKCMDCRNLVYGECKNEPN